MGIEFSSKEQLFASILDIGGKAFSITCRAAASSVGSRMASQIKSKLQTSPTRKSP
jgi:hypothetical protein